MSKFKVGDKVKLNKLVGNFKYGKGGVNFKSIGKIIGITENNEYYVDFPICDCWHGREKELILVKEKYTYEDLKKSPIGTKVTFENSLTLVKTKCNRLENDMSLVYTDELTDLQNEGLGKIIKIEEPEYRTVYEKEKEILDKEEKEYLSVVIKPFRNRVESIQKKSYRESEYIKINIKVKIQGNSSLIDDILLPYFKQGTMYKGMKVDKEYTLKELGL